MTDEIKIAVRDLYKIFGPNPEAYVDAVRNGMGKDELLEAHGHVLGLCDINVNVRDHSIAVIMGLSGSGKSTLIRHFNRIIEPTVGRIEVGGRNILELNESQLRDFRRQEISMVFQRFALLPHRSIMDNVAYGVIIQGASSAEARQRAGRWIERVGLNGYEDHYPAQLSGGMQQRVGLARALATDADILLMDEAFSALDPLIRTDMQNMLLELQSELKKTIVFITHDLDEALKLGDDIAILRDGKLVQQDDAQHIVLNPADDYVEDFVRDINRGRVVQVRSIMSEAYKESAGADLKADCVLEQALEKLAESDTQCCNVVDAAGRPIGNVSLQTVVDVMTKREAVPAA